MNNCATLDADASRLAIDESSIATSSIVDEQTSVTPTEVHMLRAQFALPVVSAVLVTAALAGQAPTGRTHRLHDEPGIYIPGEFGVRLEDDMVITDAGAELFTPQSSSLEDPFGV
jgi:hypothetical protein